VQPVSSDLPEKQLEMALHSSAWSDGANTRAIIRIGETVRKTYIPKVFLLFRNKKKV
jgi:hypothetical protein